MRKIIQSIVYILCVYLLLSCSNDIDNSLSENIHDEMVPQDSLVITEETEDIIHLKETMESIKDISTRIYDIDYEYNSSSNLYAIDGLPFYIKSKSYNNGKQYVTSDGANRELYLNRLNASANTNIFYIKKYSATTGIDNLIYSMQTNTPLVLGYYKSNKDKSIVFPNSSNSIGMSGDWTINQTNTNEYVSILNNIPKQGSSGSMWDIYYESMGIGASNKIVFGKYITNNPDQEFTIELVKGFTIDKIEFKNPYNTASIENVGTIAIEGNYLNSNNTQYNASVPIIGSKLEYPKSSFKTKKQPIAYKLTNLNFSIERPLCINGKLYLTPNNNTKKSLSYNGYQYIDNININREVDMIIPPRTLVEFKYFVTKYKLEIDYELIASYNHNGDIRKIKLTGRWSGEVYSDDLNNIEITQTPIDGNQNNGGDFDLKSKTSKTFNIKEKKTIKL